MQIYNQMFQDQYSQKGVLQSSVLRIQNLQIALQRAVEDISLLQKNLAYVIQVKEQLEQEVKVRQKREETIIKQFQRQLAKKQNEIEALKNDREQIAQLLSDTRDNLNSREATIMQREQERRRFERIIQDQRSTMQVLQEQLLAAKYNSDLSYQSISFDNIKIQEMEKENDSLRLQIGKIKLALEKQTLKCKKTDKQIQGFKNWLGSVLGIRKVVQGCEQILMQQIQSRLSNYTKY